MKLLAGLFSSLSGGVQQLVITGLIAVAIFGAGYLKGAASVHADIADEKLDVALAYAGEIVARQDLADDLAEENATLRTTQSTKDRIITKEVIKYEFITLPGERRTLPGTFRLLHDAAATGQPPAADAGSLALAAPESVADASLLQTVAENYANCRDISARLAGWQRRYQALEVSQ